jgi:hypothetical protein
MRGNLDVNRLFNKPIFNPNNAARMNTPGVNLIVNFVVKLCILKPICHDTRRRLSDRM